MSQGDPPVGSQGHSGRPAKASSFSRHLIPTGRCVCRRGTPMPICTICHARLTAARRKYCSDICTKEAIRRWKRDVREQTRQLWRAGLSAEPPWMDGWKTPDARRAYFREYMRRRRRARREGGNPVETRITPQRSVHSSSSSVPQKRVTESGVRASWQKRAAAAQRVAL